MENRWWKALKSMALRRAVAALMCFAMINTLAAEIHAVVAHASAVHSHDVNHSEMDDLHGSGDLHHNTHTDKSDAPVGNNGSQHGGHAPCDHVHCSVAFVLPQMINTSQSNTDSRLIRIPNDHTDGQDLSSIDRPPIAIL